MNQLIQISPFEAEVSVVSNGKRVWRPCTVVGVKDGSTRHELIVLYKFDGDMLCAVAVDDVRIKRAQPPTGTPLE